MLAIFDVVHIRINIRSVGISIVPRHSVNAPISICSATYSITFLFQTWKFMKVMQAIHVTSVQKKLLQLEHTHATKTYRHV